MPDKAAVQLSDMWDLGKSSQIRLAPAAQDERASYPEGCLLLQLHTGAAAAAESGLPPAKLCFTEQELVLQVGICSVWPAQGSSQNKATLHKRHSTPCFQSQ
jgi:hypothetical protein